MEVDPEHFEDGASDNNGVKSVEGRVEESHRTQGIHSNQHFKDEGTQKHEFHINWKISQKINKLGLITNHDTLTKELCKPLWLIVMFHRHCAGVKEDQDNHEPKPS